MQSLLGKKMKFHANEHAKHDFSTWLLRSLNEQMLKFLLWMILLFYFSVS